MPTYSSKNLIPNKFMNKNTCRCETGCKIITLTLPHPPYSPDLAPPDYHFFISMSHALSTKDFNNYEDAEKWHDDWTTSKDEQFFGEGIQKLPERMSMARR